jgi:hypothetical protein
MTPSLLQMSFSREVMTELQVACLSAGVRLLLTPTNLLMVATTPAAPP